MIPHEIVEVITGFIGSIGFGVLFNIRGKRLWAASLMGLLSWVMFLGFKLIIDSDPVIYFIIAVILSVIAYFFSVWMKTPTTTFILTSIVPLIPGGSLYSTMAFAFAGETERFAEKGLYTLSLAAALALGIMVSSVFIKMFAKKK